MATQEEKNKARNQQIAENEEARQIAGNIRVSLWAIVFAIILVAAAVWTGWGWLHH
jgi:heme/copper-type cytochrome/quinol oxidase subunit 2